MNRDEITRMAREAGFTWEPINNSIWRLERFATLVAAAEREACATFLERVVDLSHLNKHRVWQKYTADLLANCAAAIRARGQG